MKEKMDDVDRKRMEEAYQLTLQRDYEEASRILLELFNEGYEFVSTNLAWIYNQKEYQNKELAKKYYTIASNIGDPYAYHGLAGVLYEAGDINQAIIYYEKAGELGNCDCLYCLYKIYKSKNDILTARVYLKKASDCGNTFAIRDRALFDIRGGSGIMNIPKGLIAYLKNFPNLMRDAKSHYNNKIDNQ